MCYREGVKKNELMWEKKRSKGLDKLDQLLLTWTI